MMSRLRRACCWQLAACIVAGIASAAKAEPGVDRGRILFGQAAAFEGPAAELGRDMRAGISAAFAEVNRSGGVRGRKLELVSEDDGYEPTKSIAATRKLIDEHKVFGLIGPVGTPTSAAAQPIAQAAGVPFIGPFTGAEFLRNPFKPNVVNVRASYYQETEEMVARLTGDLGVTRIAVFHQDDSFGRAGLDGVERALAKRVMELAAVASFERNTIAVKRALLGIEKARPEAVIMVAPYRPAAEFIKRAREIGMGALLINISFVGSVALAKEAGAAGAGVVITQVVPFPEQASVPVVGRYQAALKALDSAAKLGFGSLEGYLVARLVIAALERIPGEPTRAALLETIFKGGIAIDGVRFNYSPTNNQGLNDVFLTVIEPDGSLQPIRKLERKRSASGGAAPAPVKTDTAVTASPEPRAPSPSRPPAPASAKAPAASASVAGPSPKAAPRPKSPSGTVAAPQFVFPMQ